MNALRQNDLDKLGPDRQTLSHFELLTEPKTNIEVSSKLKKYWNLPGISDLIFREGDKNKRIIFPSKSN